MRIKEIELPSGTTVRYREVPTYSLNVVYERHPAVPMPKVSIPSAAGGSEIHAVLEGTPEWEEYVKLRRERTISLARAVLDFSLDYGIMEWQFPNYEDDEGITIIPGMERDAPDDWEIPAIMLRYGATAPKDQYEKRLVYIKHEVIVTEDDVAVMDKVLAGKQPVEEKEVRTAMTPFASRKEASP